MAIKKLEAPPKKKKKQWESTQELGVTGETRRIRNTQRNMLFQALL